MIGMNPMDRSSYIAPYKPLPWQIAPWKDKSPILLLAGTAGTGKSRLAAEKLHGYLMKYPNSTGLALRKTRQSMTNSTVLFLDRSIIGNDPRVKHVKSEHRFEYANGSILAYGGMADEEQREQIRSIGVAGGVDIAWMEEAIRFTEDDYQELLGRMRGQAAPWQQVMLSTNPGPPGHWINQRLIMGQEASTYDKARPEDNPYNPPAYIDNLKRLTGILRMRLWEGQWCQAEGLVYQEFDLDNLTDDEPDFSLPFELGIDDGYVDPRAILFVQRRGSDILVFDEIYESRKLAQVHSKQILSYCIDHSKVDKPSDWQGKILEEAAQYCREKEVPLPEIAIVSPNAKELQGAMRLADIPCRKANDDVVQGIQTVRELIKDGNDQRILKVNRRCKNFIREITETYVYPEGARKDNEKPKDGNDHACEGFRYWAHMRAR
jgi:PBSX family phage terminase large subunit